MPKRNLHQHLPDAIRKAHEGEPSLDALSRPGQVHHYEALGRAPDSMTTRIAPLTERERQIADLAMRGHASKVIARRLAISDSTVRHHLTSIYAKLSMTGRLGLASNESSRRS